MSGTLLLGSAFATPAGAAPAQGQGHSVGHGFNFVNDASYILDMRSAGLETEADIPAATYQDYGYSEVNLSHDLGERLGQCHSYAALYWMGQYVEEAVLGFGAAPPDAGSVSGGYHNPVYSRSDYPNLSAGNSLSDRHPGIVNYFPPGQEITPLPAQGTPLRIQSHCDNDINGHANGDAVDVSGTVDEVGSTTASEVNRVTGVYTSTARAYVTGIKGAGGVNTISSMMQVTQKPNAQPLVTYRMSLFNSGTGSTDTGLNGRSFVFVGRDVPANELTDQFNSQAKTLTVAASAIGPFGFQILAPQTGTEPSTEAGTTGLHYITAPAVGGEAGFNARNGTIGQKQYSRFGSVTFTGVNGEQPGS
ncbi:MAG TPA: hypothetical protein VHV82_15375 [Sporichthyaceae bacterium]|jgi:hypothetical protein|nr:hypothetical protein [Sporichthyaceae bacterium]